MQNFPAEAVQEQLERIVASPEFVNGPKLGRFLSYVVGQTLHGHPDTIKQYTIAVEALGYGTEFDPTNNTTVRLLAGRLRRALERYYANQGAADPIRIDIPKGSYVPVFDQNRAASTRSNRTESPPPFAVKTPHELTEPTIAVFEFENLNDQGNKAFIAKGLTGEILTALTRFAGLSVLGPFAQSKDRPINCRQLYREYGATFALRGWIRSYRSIIRITTDLIDASDGSSPWGQTFEFDLETTSLFEIEDEVTSRVAGSIGDGLGILFQKMRSESYQKHIKYSDVTRAVLCYNTAWLTELPEDFDEANKFIDQALTRHPNDALLVALRANLHYADVVHWLDWDPDAISKFEALAIKAAALDPNLQIAQYNLVVLNGFLGRTEQCLEAARKVVDMNPNHARILAGCATQTASVGAYELGLELIEKAKRLNPQYPGWYFFANYLVDFHSEEYERAWVDAQMIHIEGVLWHPLLRAAVLGKLGRADEAKPYVIELLQIKPDFLQRPREYLKRLFVTDEHVDMIWDGLQKADIQSSTQRLASNELEV